MVTWNLQGAHGVDVPRVAAIIGSTGADIVALQEVQRKQATALAAALSVSSRRWVFKHWPVVAHAEGLAVLAADGLRSARSFPLRRAPFWDWRRRIGLDATAEIGGRAIGIVVVHLSPHDAADRRRGEAATTLRRAARHDQPPVIVGDLNDLPDERAHRVFIEAGWVDAWRAVHGDGCPGATNWTPGDRLGRSPTQRLDYVLVPAGWHVEQCSVVADAGLEELARLSDHLPLAATLRLPADVDQ